MKNTFILIIFFFIAVLMMKLFGLSIPLTITQTNKSTELSVIGEGKVEVVPDVAYVDVGITVNRAKTVEEAQGQINKVNNDIIAAMSKLNIPKKNIKTSNYSIYPMFNYDSGKEVQDGYNGNVTISIKTQGTDPVAQVIAEATKAGANQVQGTRFEVENPSKYREEARAKAIANAKEQAQKLAKDLGIKLGKVSNIVEFTQNSGGMPMYAFAEKSAMGGGGGAPAIEAGSQTITSSVTLFFEKR